MSRAERLGPPILLVAAVFASFWPSLSGTWLSTWDDNVNFLQNPHYRGLGWSNLAWMFTNTMGHYMPLTWLSLGLDYELWGMNPAGYRFTNVLLHAINALLAYGLLLAFLRRRGAEGRVAILAAAGGALLYALHPLRVESVAWITERRDLMAGLFFIPSVTFYLKSTELAEGSPERKRALAISVGLFAASLLSKTIGMTLPAALLALDFALGRLTRESWRRVCLEKAPYAALMLAGVVLTGIATENAGSFRKDVRYDAAQLLSQPGYKLGLYTAKTLVPEGLSPMYEYRAPRGLFESRFVLTSGGVLGLSALLFSLRRRWPGALAAWAAFAALLAPVCSHLQAGAHVIADRYTYLAGLVAGFAGAAALARAAAAAPGARAAAFGAAALLLAAAGVATHRYSRVWTDSETLWTRVIELDPGFWSAYNSRGVYRTNLGRHDGALADLNEAARLAPNLAPPRVNLARLKAYRRDLQGAMVDIDAALALDPNFAYGHHVKGEILQALNRLPEAEAAFNRALELDRVLLDSYVERAAVRGQLGRLKEAVQDCTLALAMDPNRFQAYLNRAVARGELGDLDGALADYGAALNLNPKSPEAWGGRGMCLASKGRWAEAARSFEQALAVAGPKWPHRADTQRRLAEARSRAR